MRSYIRGSRSVRCALRPPSPGACTFRGYA
ncbi:MAG: hypothetical protein IJA58_05625 [Lachnospiraceae bacterium]|nr:hypothetical protein [Lachnospiraceae bacterium]